MNLKVKEGIELFCHYDEVERTDGIKTKMALTSSNVEKMSEINQLRKLINQKIEMFAGVKMKNIRVPQGILHLKCYNNEELLAQTNRITDFSRFLKSSKKKFEDNGKGPVTFKLMTEVELKRR